MLCVNVLSAVSAFKGALTSLFKEATSGEVPDSDAGADMLVKFIDGPIPESGSLSEGCVCVPP